MKPVMRTLICGLVAGLFLGTAQADPTATGDLGW